MISPTPESFGSFKLPIVFFPSMQRQPPFLVPSFILLHILLSFGCCTVGMQYVHYIIYALGFTYLENFKLRSERRTEKSFDFFRISKEEEGKNELGRFGTWDLYIQSQNLKECRKDRRRKEERKKSRL